jgi:transposase-like protein
MKRRKYSQDFKEQVKKEAMETGNCSLVARRHELSSSLVARWVRELKNGKNHNTENKVEVSFKEITKENQDLSQENEHLKKILGDKDLEIEILKDLIKKKNPHLLKKLK